MHFWIAIIILGVVGGGAYGINYVITLIRQLQDELMEEMRHRASDIQFLNEFTRKLADVKEAGDAMEMVLHHVLDVLQAEAVGIYVVERDAEGKKLRGAACTGTFPAFDQSQTVRDLMIRIPRRRPAHFVHEVIPFSKGLLGRAVTKGDALVLNENMDRVPDLPRNVSCMVATPMEVEHRIIGLVVAVNCREEGRRFEERDAEMLSALSCQAALARNLIQVYSKRSQQERLLQELRIGRELQRSLLPSAINQWGTYQFAVYTEAALEVAGDYYDFIPIDEDRMLVMVADATGKGVSACMLMAMCRSFAHASAETYTDMPAFLSDMSRRLFADTDPAHFVTLAAIMLDRKAMTCEYGCAGHTPLLLRRSDGGVETIRMAGPALGMLPGDLGVGFNTRVIPCPPGTQLLLFSDGITEALNDKKEEFGLDRLEALWRDHPLPLQKMVELITDRVANFADKEPQADDQTMVVIETGSAPTPS